LTFERRFDVVICEQVLKHVEDPYAATENLRRLCAPEG
jgi:2-polyprenyl-3-methyl-5-hydroxy-6-metoxy-1,4-benzoquinol methylase